jgi:hypothetical protein
MQSAQRYGSHLSTDMTGEDITACEAPCTFPPAWGKVGWGGKRRGRIAAVPISQGVI